MYLSLLLCIPLYPINLLVFPDAVSYSINFVRFQYMTLCFIYYFPIFSWHFCLFGLSNKLQILSFKIKKKIHFRILIALIIYIYIYITLRKNKVLIILMLEIRCQKASNIPLLIFSNVLHETISFSLNISLILGSLFWMNILI